MLIKLYTDGFGPVATRSMELPAPGQSAAASVDGYYSVNISHLRRSVHPSGSADEWISGEENAYHVAIATDPQWDFSRMYTKVSTDVYEYPESRPRPSTPDETSTTTLDYNVRFIDVTIRSFLTRSVYLDSQGWIRQTYDDSFLEISIYVTSHQFKLTYDPNGGAVAPSAQYFYAKGNIALSSIQPSRRFYSFAGWDENPYAQRPQYTPAGVWTIYNAPSRDITLYAIWTSIWTYLPMRTTDGAKILVSDRNGLIIRHGDETYAN